MTRTLRIIDTGMRAAECNIAMTAALVALHGRGEIGDTLRFHRYQPSVLLGHSQDAEANVDVAYCRREGIAVARRCTGGGAVFMSPHMLAWDVIVARSARARGFDALTGTICGGVAAGLARLGVAARFSPPNAIEIDGRKVSGSSGYAGGTSAVLQGTILCRDETETMAAALRLPLSSLRTGVTCLAKHLPHPPALEDVAAAIAAEVAAALGRTAVREDPTAAELATCGAAA